VENNTTPVRSHSRNRNRDGPILHEIRRGTRRTRLPQPGQKTSSHGVPASSAARSIGCSGSRRTHEQGS
jgi:hypothetical protein